MEKNFSLPKDSLPDEMKVTTEANSQHNYWQKYYNKNKNKNETES